MQVPKADESDFKRLVLQHLRVEGYTEAAHCLERESRVYLDAEHVADLVRRGVWNEVERYVGAFAGPVAEDRISLQIFYALCRQKDIEALDRQRGRSDTDTASARDAVALKIKKLIEENPRFQDKLEFPPCEESRLLAMAKQSIMRQHYLCKLKQEPNRDVNMLYNDLCDSDVLLYTEPECQKGEQITKSAQKHEETAKPAEIAPPDACPKCTAAPCCCLTLATPSLPHGLLAKETPSLVQPPDRANLPMHPTITAGAPSIDYPTKRTSLGHPDKEAINSRNMDLKEKDESEKITIRKSSRGFLQVNHLPDEATTYRKVVGLLYKNDGMSLLALGSNGILKFWKWQPSDTNSNGKLWQPANRMVMKNDTSHGNPEEATACIAMSKKGLVILSASGGRVSAFELVEFKSIIIMLPPPVATFIMFYPEDNKIFVFGMEDGTIQIFDIRICQITNKLKGHQKRITGLSFYPRKNVLVSSGADTQLCCWSTRDWKKKHSTYLKQHPDHSGAIDGDTRVQFDNNCGRLLVVHESLLAIYDWKLECLCMWYPGKELRSRISSAVFSAEGLLIYAGFCDDTVKIFQGDSLELFCTIQPSDYVQGPLSCVGSVYPMVIAAHPSLRDQIALGMSDGEVIVLDLSLETWAYQEGVSPQGNLAQLVLN